MQHSLSINKSQSYQGSCFSYFWCVFDSLFLTHCFMSNIQCEQMEKKFIRILLRT